MYITRKFFELDFHYKFEFIDARVPFWLNFLNLSEIGLVCRFFQDLLQGEGLRIATDKLDSKNFYAFNPSFDKHCNKR